MNHKQCKLQKVNKSQTAWIPEKFARIGHYVKLKGNDGWKIIEVYSSMDSKEVQKRSTDYRNQRKASDI